MLSLKSEFLLDPGIAFLNHGSFGTCPRPVFEAFQRYNEASDLERLVDALAELLPAETCFA